MAGCGAIRCAQVQDSAGPLPVQAPHVQRAEVAERGPPAGPGADRPLAEGGVQATEGGQGTPIRLLAQQAGFGEHLGQHPQHAC